MGTIARRRFLSQVTGMAGLAAGSSPASPLVAQSAHSSKKLNFVFIFIDDLGWTDLGCYGSSFYETPNVDRLASQGMTFTDAYAAAPYCVPTRASVMSGKYPARFLNKGVVEARGQQMKKLLEVPMKIELPLSEITFAERLKETGYTTGYVGKWHLGREPLYPEKQGFDVNVAGTHIGMVQDFFYPGWTKSLPLEGEPGEYLPERLATEAVTFIENNQDRAFFLFFSPYLVHIPIQAREELVAKYERKNNAGKGQNNPTYAAMIESMDQNVGRVLDRIEKLGLANHTVVIFTSDNGGLTVRDGPTAPAGATSNKPLRAGKGSLYEGGIRVPLIVRWPGTVEPGSRCETPVSSIDYYPTILDIAGTERDAKQLLDGVSLVPLLNQKSELRPRDLHWHFPHYDNPFLVPVGAIRHGDYKLLEFFEEERVELYSLREDIGEENDLAVREPARASELQRRLAEWRKSVGAAMPAPNPKFNASR